MNDRMTSDEFLRLFGHQPEDARWMSAADSAEYLGVVIYLVNRQQGDPGR